jgi:hypothetical protein
LHTCKPDPGLLPKKPGTFPSKDAKCNAFITSVDMGGYLRLSVENRHNKLRSYEVNDITGLSWLTEDELLYSVSPIYGSPGIYLLKCTSMKIVRIIGPKKVNKAFPYGADYFELRGFSKGITGKVYFYYSPDVDLVNFNKLRTNKYLYEVNLDGSDFSKIDDKSNRQK